jgi:hypothetical protein
MACSGDCAVGSRELDVPTGREATPRTRWRDSLQELRELGAAGVAFRLRWELGLRSGWVARSERPPEPWPGLAAAGGTLIPRLPFAAAHDVRSAMAGRIGAPALAALGARAREAAHGRIRCFGRWSADFGDPIDWHLNPSEGRRWDPDTHWSAILADTGRVGDVKLTWEVGRFPHAYELARAAALGAMPPAEAASALASQVAGFLLHNPYGRGVHWASGQETVIRLAAWAFAASTLREEPCLRPALPGVARHLYEGAVHLERYLDYARKAVTNNHLVSEAFGLYQAGALLPGSPRSRRWIDLGIELLTEQADRQFHADGGYLMHSHNYQRAALQTYLLAAALRRRAGQGVPGAWTSAMARSLDFLLAHQNPADGRLPNFGSNDGGLPAILSTCDHADYRPLLQSLSLAARGERLFEAGPWDEEAAWLLGPAALDAPLRAPRRASVSFGESGYHVLRGRDPGTFSCLRCGTLRDRYAQIDMLHLDVHWRGQNVLLDAGTYLYNGPAEWHRHFTGGASHNTVTLDGNDQMVHHRRFKVLYLTRARLLRFQDGGTWCLVEGEHDGFRRRPGGCIHRRSVLHVKDDAWVVVDRIEGAGRHAARLHWLAAPVASAYDPEAGRLTLHTPAGDFTVTTLGPGARPLGGDLVSGAESPPRGWWSRYYGEKVAAPSLAVVQQGDAPLEFVSILASGRPRAECEGTLWRVEAGGSAVSFRLRDGRFEEIEVAAARGRAG